MSYKIKELADLAGVSVRTLHHYDHVGLLKPGSMTSAGYRLYNKDDLNRLQQILFFKELGFELKMITMILDNPGFDYKESLLNQKALLEKKRNRLDRIIASVEKTLDSLTGGKQMSNKEMFQAFDMAGIKNHQKKYTDEVKQKYGHTQSYKESRKKTSGYTKQEWAEIMARGNEIYSRLATLTDREPSDPEVQRLIGEWRQHITDSFYTCTLEIFRGLGNLYVDDNRFTKNIDKYKPGLAHFMRDAIHYYCNNHKEE